MSTGRGFGCTAAALLLAVYAWPAQAQSPFDLFVGTFGGGRVGGPAAANPAPRPFGPVTPGVGVDSSSLPVGSPPVSGFGTTSMGLGQTTGFGGSGSGFGTLQPGSGGGSSIGTTGGASAASAGGALAGSVGAGSASGAGLGAPGAGASTGLGIAASMGLTTATSTGFGSTTTTAGAGLARGSGNVIDMLFCRLLSATC